MAIGSGVLILARNRVNLIGILSRFSRQQQKQGLASILSSKMSTISGTTPSDQTSDINNDGDDDEIKLTTGTGLLKIFERNPKRLKRIKFLGELFESHGFELRIAGGAVRDILRGKEPQDIDFATTAKPEESLSIVSKHDDLLRIIVTPAGQRHGTVAVKFKEGEINVKRIKLSNLPQASSTTSEPASKPKEPVYDDESPYEITTLRCDVLTDGRHAEVEFINDWRKDAERRDLTINAMFLTLADGRLIDYFGGESDLRDGVVRFVGDTNKRIQEDYLRILRFFRFWSRYSRGKKTDDETLEKIKSNLKGLEQISGERIWQELKKTLCHLPCIGVVELMLKLRLFDYAGLMDENLESYDQYTQQVLNDIKVVQENVQKYSNDVLQPQLKANPDDEECKKLKELLPVILFSTVVQTVDLCISAQKRVRFSNIERDTILNIISNRDKDPNVAALKYQLVISPVPERPHALRRIKAYLIYKGKFELINELAAWKVPNFPLSGSIVSRAIKERGLPGNKTKEVLELVKLDWAKNNYNLKEDDLIQKMRAIIEEISIANK